MMERDELAAWLRLVLAPGLGNAGARKLLAAFGPPQAVFAQSRQALAQVLTPTLADSLLAQPAELAAQTDATVQWLEAAPAGDLPQRRLVTLGDAAYPPSLLETADPPLLLFMQGRCDAAFDAARSIAIVGSRNPTPQGQANAREFARAFGDAGLVVISGLALGVDGAAHEGALDSTAGGNEGVATIAVVGTGLDRVYPARHAALAERVAGRGLVISEFLLGTPPLAGNFPKRNRVIAGLAQGTLVVEAALQSGSLITARMALEQGREVFAIPGSIHSPQSRGCHALIKQGAKLVESAQDVLEELRLPSVSSNESKSAATAKPTDELLECLGFDPVSIDALIARTGISAATLQARLLELELDGHVARLPGALFQRMASG